MKKILIPLILLLLIFIALSILSLFKTDKNIVKDEKDVGRIESYTNSVEEAVKKMDAEAGIIRPIKVEMEKDITGDGINEYLVNMGIGGASTDQYTVLSLNNGVYEPIKIKEKSTTTIFTFVVGSGGAGRYASEIKLDESRNAIITRSYSIYDDESDFCTVKVYIWDMVSQSFVLNDNITNEEQREFLKECNKLK